MQYTPHMVPMGGGRGYKQPHQGGRSGGRGSGSSAASGTAASSSSSAPQAGAESGAGRGTGRGTSQEPQKQGLTIHRAGPGGAPVRTRPQSAVEPRSTPPAQEPFDSEVCLTLYLWLTHVLAWILPVPVHRSD